MSTLKLKSYEHETNNIVACLGRTAVRSSFLPSFLHSFLHSFILSLSLSLSLSLNILPIRFVTACPAFPYPVLPPPKTVSLRSTPPFRFAIALSDSASLHGPPLLRCRGWHGSLEKQPFAALPIPVLGVDRPPTSAIYEFERKM